MKILIIKNKGVNERFYKREVKYLSYFSELKKTFGIPNIKFSIDEITSDEKITIAKKGTATNGKTGYTLKSIDKNIIPHGYDFVLFAYKGVSLFSKNKGNYSYSRKKSINGAFVGEITDKANKYTMCHELVHLMFYKVRSLGYKIYDQMDRTKVRGVWISYYKNKYPYVKGGNYNVSLNILKPYIKYLEDKVVIKQNPIVSFFTPKNKTTYKYFSLKEVAGLSPKLVVLLDKARGLAGIPFSINSGFRSPAQNKKVGGVKNSAHLKGLAVDIRARNGEEAYKIINSAMKVGIKRIGINRKKKFVHLDIDYTKPNPTVYEY